MGFRMVFQSDDLVVGICGVCGRFVEQVVEKIDLNGADPFAVEWRDLTNEPCCCKSRDVPDYQFPLTVLISRPAVAKLFGLLSNPGVKFTEESRQRALQVSRDLLRNMANFVCTRLISDAEITMEAALEENTELMSAAIHDALFGLDKLHDMLTEHVTTETLGDVHARGVIPSEIDGHVHVLLSEKATRASRLLKRRLNDRNEWEIPLAVLDELDSIIDKIGNPDAKAAFAEFMAEFSGDPA
jgi:hypothetical protein